MAAPLVLLHGYTGTPGSWAPVLPLLRAERSVHALTLAGHTGGPSLPRGTPATVEAVVDVAEAEVAQVGDGRPHLVGLSLGSWVALELAARGRARSVIALTPAGFWERGDGGAAEVAAFFRAAARRGRTSRPLLPLLARSAAARRLAVRDLMEHGDRLSPQEMVQSVHDFLDCPAYPSLVDDVVARDLTCNAAVPLDVPVLVAQAERDRVFPPRRFEAAIRRRLPHAELRTLPGVGHVPLVDDPDLIARTVLDWADEAEAARSTV